MLRFSETFILLPLFTGKKKEKKKKKERKKEEEKIRHRRYATYKLL
jgi:hypothetical protein